MAFENTVMPYLLFHVYHLLLDLVELPLLLLELLLHPLVLVLGEVAPVPRRLALEPRLAHNHRGRSLTLTFLDLFRLESLSLDTLISFFFNGGLLLYHGFSVAIGLGGGQRRDRALVGLVGDELGLLLEVGLGALSHRVRRGDL